MKKIKILGAVLFCSLFSVVCVGCDLGSGNANRGDMTWAIESNYKNIVSITAHFVNHTSSGTGVLIYKGGYIATNAHVIAKTVSGPGVQVNHEVASRIDIEFWTDHHYDGSWDELPKSQKSAYIKTIEPNYNTTTGTDSNSRVLYWDITEDLAIIRCPSLPKGYEDNSAVIRNSAPEANPLKMGEPVVAMGFSLAEYYRSSVGVVSMTWSELKGTTNDEDSIQKNIKYAIMHDAITVPGNSGGPIFDALGRCMGLNTLIALLETTDKNVLSLGLGLSIALSSRTILSKMSMLGLI